MRRPHHEEVSVQRRNLERRATRARGRASIWLPGIAVVGLLAGASQLAPAAQEHEIERLDFKVGAPRTVAIYPGAGKEGTGDDFRKAGRVFWYLPYHLKNLGSQPARFFVSVSATSDKNVRYSDLPLIEVEERVETLEQRKFLSKADLRKEKRTAGDYESFAPDETKECIAIFNPLDPEADKITVRVYGLVNDIQMKQLDGENWELTERVLEVIFERPGDEFYTSLDRFKYVDQRWTKETRKVKIPVGAE